MNVYLYLNRNSILHRIDARTKMFIMLGAFILAFVFSTPLENAIVLAIVLTTALIAKALENLWKFKTLLIIVLIMTTVMFSLTWRGETPLFWFIEQESVVHGITIGLRLTALISVGLLFLSITTNEEILVALVRLGIPYRFAFALSTALRLVPTVIGTAMTISEAQRCRGLDVNTGSIFTRAKNMAPTIIPVIVSTIRGTQTFSIALNAKGFGAMPTRTFLIWPRFSNIDAIVAIIVSALIAIAFWLRYAGITISFF